MLYTKSTELTGIKDSALSRNQVKLVANLQSCTVQVIPLAVNPSGVNGFSLKRHTEYTLHHKDRLELLLDQYVYEIIFDPAPKLTENQSKRICTDAETKEPINKQQKCDKKLEKCVSGWEEIDNKKLFIFTAEGVTPSPKIAGFDLDGTIILTKSGARFPKDAEDWRFAFAEVRGKLKSLHDDNYKVVIFTNQAGIGLGKLKLSEFKVKVEKILSALDIPVQVFVSTGKGVYRKPAPGMWDSLCKEKNGNVSVNVSESFYCGDAAGRDKNWAPKMKKDHSIGDRLFALNLGIKFQTPEEYFLGARKVTFTMPVFDPTDIQHQGLLIPESSSITSDKQEVIVFVGSPGSGKSHVCKTLLVPEGYVHVNRDQLGSWQKCVTAMETAMVNKQSVAIDNTNPDKESRKRYIDVASKHGVPCRCFVMTTSIQHAKHNNIFREIIDKNHQAINEIIINSYKNKLTEPQAEEGFEAIVKVNCLPKFDNPEHDRLYHMYLLEK
ncbi:Polynucleotide kinase 3'-phosphatase [Carabus blaptoides fortunei]